MRRGGRRPNAQGYHVPVSTPDELAEGASAAAVLELVDLRVPAERAEAVRTFAKAFTRRLSPSELKARTPEELLSVVLGAFELVDERQRGEVAVRVFEPSLAVDGYAPPGAVIQVATPDSPFLFDSVTEELQAREPGGRRRVPP